MGRRRDVKRDLKIYDLVKRADLSVREVARVVGISKSGVHKAYYRVINHRDEYKLPVDNSLA